MIPCSWAVPLSAAALVWSVGESLPPPQADSAATELSKDDNKTRRYEVLRCMKLPNDD